ncbi:MAG: NADH-quinone oxidoreductase subunit I [Chloroflexi bacterium]|nr:NADH-quinone oxidoreductase subunit I [Chloroflexota bacterium]
MLGMLKGLMTTMQSHFRKPVTIQYPDERPDLPPRYAGFPGLIWDANVGEPFCTGCQVCARFCPTQCIYVTMKDNPKVGDGTSKRRKIVDEFELNVSCCTQCAVCVEVCNFDAIEMTHTFEMASYSREQVMNLQDMLSMKEKGGP